MKNPDTPLSHCPASGRPRNTEPAGFRKWPVFLIVATGVFMSTLDSSMVNIALPFIMREMHSSLRSTEWVMLAYLLTITATLLFWGHLSDRLGRKPIYAAGLFLFAAGSLACSLAPDLASLIGFRLAQATGAAMLMAAGPAIIRETFPRKQLGRGLGLIGVAVALGLMSGPSLGGVILEFASWRYLFLLTVPIGLAAGLAAGRLLPAVPRARGQGIDWPGALCWAMALTGLSLTLSHLSAPRWSTATLLTSSGLSLLSLTAFLWGERRTSQPLLDLTLFSDRAFSMAVVSAVLSFMVLFAVILLTPFYLDRIRHLAALRIGLVMVAIPASLLVMGPTAGWLAERLSARLLTTTGLVLATGGVLLLTTLRADTPLLRLALFLAMVGGGQSLFLSPNSASVLGLVRLSQAGASAALLATARNLGMLLGVAQAGLVFALCFARLTNGLDLKDFTPAHQQAFLIALATAFRWAGLIGFLAVLASWGRGNSGIAGQAKPNLKR